ncbi:MAG: RNase adapter RapZ [Polyangia bacterium]|mgnify:CR=1 FL=1|jgi:UPF0042 nucleotide-binding protein|nr:RNase adapter RapZ [Polyangia bacterium]
MHVVVITGMSGGGKTEALRAVEDLGIFCVDNLPIPLVGQFVDLLGRTGEVSRVALVVDVRGGEFLAGFDSVFEAMRLSGHSLEVIFFDADDAVLVRRFSETRRRHPLDKGDLRAGLAEERRLLAPLRATADLVLDTSNITVHELRRRLRQIYAGDDATLRVSLLSFGYKYGVPPEADLVFDVRFLPNPYFVEELRPLSGVDERVSSFVLADTEAQTFLERVSGLLVFLLPLYEREGKAYLTVAVGCTGGRHRSVAITEAMRERLGVEAGRVAVRHRDVERA